MISDTKEVHIIGLKNDEFIFALVDKRLKATRYPEKLAKSGRLEGLPRALMLDE